MGKKTLQLMMLEEGYPQKAWIRSYEDGSATEAVQIEVAGAFVLYPDGHGQWQYQQTLP
ncbi:hypothetical protein DPMN_166624 [Dreissena polymorpha]|uniref:Uncharacterized protein n=1 Tax=Dreissena polymorpha TaxID=45954 RepID=A0A9D4IVM6_DREPO|nr:hypothetical protein DPMN_166624 [Dreissena polymorpha]